MPQDCKVFPLLKNSQKSDFVSEISQSVNTSSVKFFNYGISGLVFLEALPVQNAVPC